MHEITRGDTPRKLTPPPRENLKTGTATVALTLSDYGAGSLICEGYLQGELWTVNKMEHIYALLTSK